MFSTKKTLSGIIKETVEGMRFLKGRVEAGKLKLVVDRGYPFEQIVAAHAYVEAGHKKGNVVLGVVADEK